MSSHTPLGVMLAKWKPNATTLDPQQIAALDVAWDELCRASEAELWGSVCFLSSQILEALLRARLELIPDLTLPEKPTLGHLIEISHQFDLFHSSAGSVLGSGSITAARILRNWSAHFNLWSRYPNSIRASQAVALTICAVEALFPTDSRKFPVAEDWDASQWREFSPGFILSQLRQVGPKLDFPAEIHLHFEDFCHHAIETGTLYTVCQLDEFLKLHEAYRPMFKSALRARFHDLVRNAAQTREKRLLWIIDILKRHDLRDFALVFAILLPIDLDIFVDLLRRLPSAWLVFYLTEAIRAEPGVFSTRLGDKSKMSEVASVFWSETKKKGSILNAANLLGQLPIRVRARLMSEISADSLVKWIEESDVLDALNICGSLRANFISHEPKLIKTRDQVTKKLGELIGQSPLDDLARMPLRLYRLRAIKDDVGTPLVKALIVRAEKIAPISLDEWDQTRRLLSDLWVFSEMSKEASDLARKLIDDSVPSGWIWPLLCLAGLTELTWPGIATGRWPEVPSTIDIPDNPDRWQLMLAAITLNGTNGNSEALDKVVFLLKAKSQNANIRVSGKSLQILDRVNLILERR